MVQKYLEQGQRRDQVQKKVEGIEKERSFHLQIEDGKTKTGIERPVQS